MSAASEIEEIFEGVLNASAHGALIVLIVAALRFGLRRSLGAPGCYLLWFLVLVRLAIPSAPPSVTSVFNFAHLISKPDPITNLDSREFAENSVATSALNPKLVSPTNVRPSKIANGQSSTQPEDAQTVQSPKQPWRWRHWMAGIWLSGFALLISYLAWGYTKVLRQLGKAERLDDAELLAVAQNAAATIRVHRPIEIYVTDFVASPALFGILRPRLLLPKKLLRALPASDWRYVFLHELAHVKRGDVPVNWLMAFLGIIHWINPMVWIGLRLMRADREFAADQLALATISPEERRAYGETMLRFLGAVAPEPTLAGAVPYFECGSSIKARIENIASFRRQTINPALRWATCLILAGLTLTDATPPSIPPLPVRINTSVTVTRLGPGEGDNSTLAKDKPNAASTNAAKAKPPTMIYGWVTNRLGEPIEHFSVLMRERIQAKPFQIFESGWNPAGNGTRGRFILPLSSNTISCEIKISSPGFASALSDSIKLQGGDLKVSFVLKPVADIKGRAFRPNGEPAPNLDIYFSLEADKLFLGTNGLKTLGRLGRLAVHTVSDAEGNFRLTPSESEGTLLAAAREGFIAMRFLGRTADVSLRLISWGRLEGTVKRLELYEGAGINVMMKQGPVYLDTASYRVSPSKDGDFLFDRMPPGQFEIGAGSFLNGAIPVELNAGDRVVMSLDFSGNHVGGRLVLDFPKTNFQWASPAHTCVLTSRDMLVSHAEVGRLNYPGGKSIRLRDHQYKPQYYLKIREDGSFYANAVPEGIYKLWVVLQDVWTNGFYSFPPMAELSTEVRVPKLGPDQASVDLGVFHIQPRPDYLLMKGQRKTNSVPSLKN